MWVGETERQIAAAFAEARAEGSILVFDEADSLLADRRGAVRSWEVSQVNEMLTWMESHPLPFACTTNFGENLDPATLRRFTFKIALDYLTPDQSQTAFRTYFALEAPDEVEDLTNLTPGDFAVVHRKAEILGHLQAPKALAELLRAECEAKPNHSRKMGFCQVSIDTLRPNEMTRSFRHRGLKRLYEHDDRSLIGPDCTILSYIRTGVRNETRDDGS